MEQTVINGYFGVDNQMPNTKALGNPDRGMYTSVSLIRPFRVEGSSQQRISSFATDARTHRIRWSNHHRKWILGKITGHRYGSGNPSRKLVMTAWTATLSSSYSRLKYIKKAP